MGEEMIAHIGTFAISFLDVSSEAFLLFLVNLVGIVVSACLVFLFQSYGNWKKAFQMIFICLIIITLLCGPLTSSMKEIIVTNEVQVQMRKLREVHSKIASQIQTRYLDIELEGKTAYIEMVTIAPEELVIDEYLKSGEKHIFDALTQMGIQSVDMVVKIVPVEVKEYKSIKTLNDD